jgi:hypothetical protein
MDIATILAIGIVLAGLAYVGWKVSRLQPMDGDARIKDALEKANKSVGELTEKLREAESKRDELAGKNKELFAANTRLEAELKPMRKALADFEAKKDSRDEQFERQAQELTASRKALDAERERMQKADEERRQRAEADRDRVWTEHENNVVAQLTALCRSPQLSFAHFTNKNLPDDFDGSLKPDFMIEFLDQYIIFDAKKSKQESLQTYMNSTMKSTVQKVKKNPRIASMIYLVVPTEAISELKQFVHYIDGYVIYVVSPESLPPILASLKKITTYEFADQMDPQQRENIIQILADFDFHINLRNAADILLSRMGTQILEKAQEMEPEISQEVALKKQPMNAKASIAAAELKKIVSNLTTQNLEIQQIISPKASIRKNDLKAAEAMMESLLDA